MKILDEQKELINRISKQVLLLTNEDFRPPGSKHFDNSIVKLEPDVVEAFPDDVFVNKTLRFLILFTKGNSGAPSTIGKVE